MGESLRKELIKIGVSAFFGLLVGIIYIFSTQNGEVINLVISPFYGIGVRYGWRQMINMLKRVTGVSGDVGITSVIFRSGTGGMISIMLLILGVAVVLVLGWIVGVFKAVGALITALSNDKTTSNYM